MTVVWCAQVLLSDSQGEAKIGKFYFHPEVTLASVTPVAGPIKGELISRHVHNVDCLIVQLINVW